MRPRAISIGRRTAGPPNCAVSHSQIGVFKVDPRFPEAYTNCWVCGNEVTFSNHFVEIENEICVVTDNRFGRSFLIQVGFDAFNPQERVSETSRQMA